MTSRAESCENTNVRRVSPVIRFYRPSVFLFFFHPSRAMDRGLIQAILLDPKYQPLLALIKGARNGLVYGVKVRFPHALVMNFLFSRAESAPVSLAQNIRVPFISTDLRWRCSTKTKARNIYRATRRHALNLCKFVLLYKTALLVQRSLNGGKERSADTFFAGLLGGWVVFSDRNPINEQVSGNSSSKLWPFVSLFFLASCSNLVC
jgi:hypothetical protein